MPRAGCVPFRKRNGTLEFLKVKGLNRGWVFPAGRVKTGETKRQAAKREAFEEAGVRGKIVGEVKTKKGNRYFLLEIKKRRRSPEKREIRWVCRREFAELC